MIRQEELYASKNECCGCELCTLVCSQNVLSMQSDKVGFLYPKIVNQTACIDCKKCVNVCPEKISVHSARTFKVGYGGYAKQLSDVRKSASGGLSYTIGQKIISNGGVVYGVAYDTDCRMARYTRASTIVELEKFRTSKYFQSRKQDIFFQVKTDLKNGINVLFVGLPCEVSALYNYLLKDYKNLYTISLMCHGTTSPRVHIDFCDRLQDLYKSNIISFSVRHKVDGWQPYYIKADFENGQTYLEKFIETDYDVAFKYLKRPSCTSCKFKLKNQKFGFKSDLIIGDYHGARACDEYYNIWGMSRFYVTSDKGKELVLSIQDVFDYTSISMRNLYTGSPVLNYPTRKLLFSSYYCYLFSKFSLYEASSNILIKMAYLYLYPLSKKINGYFQRVRAKLKK